MSGATIKKIEYVTPHYLRLIQTDANVPWMGRPYETTYMNRTKPLNEELVKDYDTIELGHIPNNKYESVPQDLYEARCIENFYQSSQFKQFICIIILILLLLVIFTHYC